MTIEEQLDPPINRG